MWRLMKKVDKVTSKWNNLSIQNKLIITFFLTSAIMLVVNFMMYTNINGMISQIEDVYESNVQLNDLRDSIEEVQSSMTEYLNTKSSESISGYFGKEQQLRTKMLYHNTEITNNEYYILEKNLNNLSEQ